MNHETAEFDPKAPMAKVEPEAPLTEPEKVAGGDEENGEKTAPFTATKDPKEEVPERKEVQRVDPADAPRRSEEGDVGDNNKW